MAGVTVVDQGCGVHDYTAFTPLIAYALEDVKCCPCRASIGGGCPRKKQHHRYSRSQRFAVAGNCFAPLCLFEAVPVCWKVVMAAVGELFALKKCCAISGASGLHMHCETHGLSAISSIITSLSDLQN